LLSSVVRKIIKADRFRHGDRTRSGDSWDNVLANRNRKKRVSRRKNNAPNDNHPTCEKLSFGAQGRKPHFLNFVSNKPVFSEATMCAMGFTVRYFTFRQAYTLRAGKINQA